MNRKHLTRAILSQMLAAYREMKASPDTVYTIPIPGDYPEHWKFAELRRWFMGCLNSKINRDDRRGWRALQPEYQIDLACDARVVNDYYSRRIRHTGCYGLLRTPELKRRYPHIDRQPSE